MEDRISKYVMSLLSGSYIVIVGGVLFLYVLIGAFSGDIDLAENTFALKFVVIGGLYISSVVLLATLAGKSNVRRLFSWIYSVIFHSGLLIYLGIAEEFGSFVFIAGLAESVVLILSLVGLGAWANNVFNIKKA